MGDKTSQGQALRLVSSFATDTRWGDLDPRDLQKFLELPASERGLRFTQFLWGQFSQRDPGPVGSMKLMINRGRFNPIEFLGEGWKIVSEETDKVSTTITRLDLSQVQLVTMLKDYVELPLNGEERLKRLVSSGMIRLDADILHALWENQNLIPKIWKEKVGGKTRYIFFDGTVLRNLEGKRYSLCLYWGGIQWHRNVFWMSSDRRNSDMSAVLVP